VRRRQLRTLPSFRGSRAWQGRKTPSSSANCASYNGETLKDVDPRSKSVKEYRDDAGMQEAFGPLDPLGVQDDLGRLSIVTRAR